MSNFNPNSKLWSTEDFGQFNKPSENPGYKKMRQGQRSNLTRLGVPKKLVKKIIEGK